MSISLESVRKDLKFATRMLLKSPGFSAVALFSLALGIGANTAVFSLIDAVMLRPLPVSNPEELVNLVAKTPGRPDESFSYPTYKEIRDKNTVFSDVFVHNIVEMTLTVAGGSERTVGELVSGNFFSALGIKAERGRLIEPTDDVTKGAHPVAVLNYRFWKNRFDGSSNVLNQTIHLNGYPFTVIGVAPRGFFGVEVGSSPDIWIPVMMQGQVMSGGPPGDMLAMPTARWLPVMARLKPGVNIQRAAAGADVLFRQILASQAQSLARTGARRNALLSRRLELESSNRGVSRLRGQFARPLYIIMGMLALVLILACANIANLLLARAQSRSTEIAVRLAIGADRSRLVTQLITESLLLAAIGGVLGLWFAQYAIQFLLALMPHGSVPMVLQVNPDARVLAFTFAVSIFAGVIFGLVPALQTTRVDLNSTLRGDSVLGLSRHRFGWRAALVVFQVAVSMLLLVCGTLLVRTLHNLRNVDAGFDPANVLTASLNPALSGYEAQRVRSFYNELLERLGKVPGVRVVSLSDSAPMSRRTIVVGVAIEGYEARPGDATETMLSHITPDFFQTLGMSLLAGRDVARTDQPNTTKVAVVNDVFARLYFAGTDAIGKHIAVDDVNAPKDVEIVGVVRSAKHQNLRDDAKPAVYVPFTQIPGAAASRVVYARTSGDPAMVAQAIGRTVAEIDSRIPVLALQTLSAQIDDTLVQERMMASLAGFFGLLALSVAAAGLYGVISYVVSQRTREFGIRLALGAKRSTVQWLVFRETLLTVLAGVVIGLPATVAAIKLFQGILFGVTANDPLSFGAIGVILVTVAAIAGYVPARRASRVNPTTALRY